MLAGLISGIYLINRFGSLDPRSLAAGCPERRCDKYQKPDGSYYVPTERTVEQKWEGREKYDNFWSKLENL